MKNTVILLYQNLISCYLIDGILRKRCRRFKNANSKNNENDSHADGGEVNDSELGIARIYIMKLHYYSKIVHNQSDEMFVVSLFIYIC